jgi:hypothetical protein
MVFRPWWDPRGACPMNCSFFSGEAATAFWTYAPAALTPPQWRPLAYVGATLFGLATGGLRIAYGGHFFHRRRHCGPRHLPRGLADVCADLPLALDALDRRGRRRALRH